MKTLFKALLVLALTSQFAFASNSDEYSRTVVDSQLVLQLKADNGWKKKPLPEFIEFMNKFELSANKNAQKQNFFCSTTITEMTDYQDSIMVHLNLSCLSADFGQDHKLDVEKLLKQISSDIKVKVTEDNNGAARTGGATVHN